MDPVIGTFIAVVSGLIATCIFSWPITRKKNQQELKSFKLNIERLKPTFSSIIMIVLFYFAFHLADQAFEKDHGGVPFVGWNFATTINQSGLYPAPTYGINEIIGDILFCLDPASIIFFCIFIGLLVVILKPPEGSIQRKKAISRANKVLVVSFGVGILIAVLLLVIVFCFYSTPDISKITEGKTEVTQSSLYYVSIGLIFITVAAIIIRRLQKQLTSEIKHEYSTLLKMTILPGFIVPFLVNAEASLVTEFFPSIITGLFILTGCATWIAIIGLTIGTKNYRTVLWALVGLLFFWDMGMAFIGKGVGTLEEYKPAVFMTMALLLIFIPLGLLERVWRLELHERWRMARDDHIFIVFSLFILLVGMLDFNTLYWHFIELFIVVVGISVVIYWLPRSYSTPFIGRVLIRIEPGEIWNVKCDVEKIEGVFGVLPLFGTYEMMAEIEAKSWVDVYRIVYRELRSVKGVTGTETLFNLEKIFEDYPL